jgi:hypothetical protein
VVVTERLNHPINLGLDALQRLEVFVDVLRSKLRTGTVKMSMKRIYDIMTKITQSVEKDILIEGRKKINRLIEQYEEIFGDIIKVKADPIMIKIKEGAKPTRMSPYRLSLAVTIDGYPLLIVDDILEDLGGKKYFSVNT